MSALTNSAHSGQDDAMRAVLLILIAALAAGCSDAKEATPNPTATTGEATTTSTAIAEGGDCQRRPTGSSPAVFDSGAGTYAAQDVTLDMEAKALTYNVVQVLSGEEARQAFHEDNPQYSDGPPNDYYIVDESPRVRTTAVGDAARVFLTHLRSDSTPAVEADTLAGLDAYMRDGYPEHLYLLTFESDVITEICEGYRP